MFVQEVAPKANWVSYTSMANLSKTLSSTSRCIAFGRPVRQRSKHGPMTMYRFSLVTHVDSVSSIEQIPRLPRAREVSSPPRPLGQDSRLSHLRIKEKALMPRLSVPHSNQHREFKATRRLRLPQSLAHESSQSKGCRTFRLGHP